MHYTSRSQHHRETLAWKSFKLYQKIHSLHTCAAVGDLEMQICVVEKKLEGSTGRENEDKRHAV